MSPFDLPLFHRPLALSASLLCLALSACAGSPPQPLPGADRDAHGCIASAGYQWCARENACERPWELAQRKGFALEKNGFAAYCGASPSPANPPRPLKP